MESLAWLDRALKGWTILPECPAGVHNTMTAATRGDRKVPGSPRCVCPRAIELRDAALRHRQEYERGVSAARKAHPNVTYASGRPLLEQIPGGERWLNQPRQRVQAPDFDRNVPCATDRGRELLTVACSSRAANSASYRAAFVRLCREQCPAYAQCLAWILNSEEPAGSWGMVYAGLTVNDRKRIGRERRAVDQERGEAGRRSGYGNRRGSFGSYGQADG